MPEHHKALLAIANAEAERKRREHPLHRIMRIDAHDERIEIATTAVHLRNASARHSSTPSNVSSPSTAEDEYSVQAHWRR